MPVNGERIVPPRMAAMLDERPEAGAVDWGGQRFQPAERAAHHQERSEHAARGP